ncbi:MAG: SMR family transporter [Acidaminobacteraceae bacterium]
MLYLILATICSATIALIFKYTENSNLDRYVITSSNYFIASVTSLFMIFSKKIFTSIDMDTSFVKEINIALTSDYILSPYSSIVWGVLVGLIAGVFFFLSFIYYQKSVNENGVGISGTFGKLGILIPMMFSVIFWKEYPSYLQWVGIVLSIVSILIVNLSMKSIKTFDVKPTLILLFAFGGLAEFSSKIYQKYALNQYKDVFLFVIFFVAFIISVAYTFKMKSKVTKKDIYTGFIVGIPNLFSSYFIILALDTLKTSVVFPLFSAGSIVLINIGGVLIFKEKIPKKNKVATAMIIFALVLINI